MNVSCGDEDREKTFYRIFLYAYTGIHRSRVNCKVFNTNTFKHVYKA